MKKLQRGIEYCMLMLVIIGSVLLSTSIGSSRLFFIAFTCAVLGFLITDTLKIFRIQGWLANVASIAILVLAMKDFFGADSSGKLIAVANLLVYLQGILMFQEKTPRLNWQILVLSLLEVVITTIFTVGFETSYLLLIYFVIAGTAMVLQCLFVDHVDMERGRRRVARSLKGILPSSGDDSPVADETIFASEPVLPTVSATQNRVGATLIFDAPEWQYRNLWPVLTQLAAWIGAGLAITLVMFLMAPRTSNPLFKAMNYEVAATGVSKKVDLNERGKISQSNRIVFRSEFLNHVTQQPMRLSEAPRFRSMALGSLKIEDGHTTWEAPFDRIDETYYESVPQYTGGRFVRVVTTLQQNSSPQIYSAMPVLVTYETSQNIKFCHEVSSLTRSYYDGKVSAAPFKYELATVLDFRNRPLKGWPYLSRGRYTDSAAYSMADEPQRRKWLTEIDLNRYPTLVAAADRIAAEVKQNNGSRRDVIEKMTEWFSANRFKYTLDYTNVERDESLDTVEDFVRNHRSGHCEMYASALTLMLRSQAIPARLVVGFLANDYSDLSDRYIVKEKHAHAWVEAYLPPEDCTLEMIGMGMASNGGCWLIADPNPLETLAPGNDGANDPIELARTVWQDLVMGGEGDETHSSLENASLLYRLFSDAKNQGQNAVDAIGRLPSQPNFQIFAVSGLLLFLLFQLYKSFTKPRSDQSKSRAKVGLLRRMVASAVGLISHDLESWVLSTGNADGTEFYSKMETLLKSHNLERTQTQTHRQFAQEAIESLKHLPAHDQIKSLIHALTERFNEVRFGDQRISEAQSAELEKSLALLKQALGSSPTASVTRS